VSRPIISDQEIDACLDALAELQQRRTARVLKQAVARNARGGSSKPDGWPRGKGYDGSGGPLRITVEPDEHGGLESLECNSVEMAVIARDRTQRDELHDAVVAAVQNLKHAASNLGQLRARIDQLENLDFDAEKANERKCQAMARINVHEDFYKRREINGVWWDLGSWAYSFAIETDRLPTVDECRARKEGRNVKRRVIEKAS